MGNLYPNSGKQAKRVEILGAAGWKSLPKRRKTAERVENPRLACPATLKTHPEIVHFSIRVCCLHIERKLKKCQRKKIQKFKEEFDKNPKDTLKHIIDKLNSELNSILHEYDFN